MSSVPALVRRLRGSKVVQRQRAASEAKQLVSSGAAARQAFLAGGGVEALAGILGSCSSPSDPACQLAVGSLCRLIMPDSTTFDSWQEEPCSALAAAGGVRQLVQLVDRFWGVEGAGRFEYDAVVLLYSIAAGPAGAAALEAAGAIPILMRLLCTSRSVNKARGTLGAAAGTLELLTRASASNSAAAAAAGGVNAPLALLHTSFDAAQELVADWEPAARSIGPDAEQLQAELMRLMDNLCDHCPEQHIAVVEGGGIQLLVRSLSLSNAGTAAGGNGGAAHAAARLLWRLMDRSPCEQQAQQEVAACGGIPALAAQMHAREAEVQVFAIHALAAVAAGSDAAAEAVVAAGAVSSAAKLLRESGCLSVVTAAAMLLFQLLASGVPACCRAVAEAGALQSLHQGQPLDDPALEQARIQFLLDLRNLRSAAGWTCCCCHAWRRVSTCMFVL